MSGEDPRSRKASIPRISELPPWALVVLGFIAVIATLVLFFLNPEKFPLIGTGAAVALYLGSAWSLVAILARASEVRESIVFNEITMMFALVLIGFLSGGLAGAAWWMLVGASYVTLGQAVLAGGFLGALVFAFLLGGF